MITQEKKQNKLAYTLTFMKEVVRTNRSTGALGPSSRELAEEVTRMADLKGRDVIVEYGPGTGIFTEVIVEKMDPGAYLLTLDVNPEFVRATQRRCPQAHVVEDGAQNAIHHLRKAGHEHCDVIVSGLPWTRFPDELQDEILQAAWDVLRPGGRFVTFAYATSPIVPSGKRFFKEKLEGRFPTVTRSKQIWKNFPPCVVYMADKRG